ncbi:MAG: lysophospholipid acyltransferase family protein [Bacteroidia bacterium]|nr:lysophospholipid acyltransferase family protein [Bacteroidia bacterium]
MEKTDLVSRDNVTKALRLDRVGLEFISPWLYKLLGMDRANQFYHRHAGLPSHEFIDALFEELQVKIDFQGAPLSQIPASGPVWFIANHPLGIWDGLIMMKLIKEARPEFKVITIFMLEKLQELRPHIVPVNSWDDKKDMGGNHASMKEIFQTILKDGNPIGLFPGGSVSRYIPQYGRITDPPWNPTALRMMSRVRAPIIPFHIDGRNSSLFYVLAYLSDTLRRGRNFAEFFNKKGRTIPVRVGNLIQPEEWTQLAVPDELSEFLRRKVYESE